MQTQRLDERVYDFYASLRRLAMTLLIIYGVGIGISIILIRYQSNFITFIIDSVYVVLLILLYLKPNRKVLVGFLSVVMFFGFFDMMAIIAGAPSYGIIYKVIIFAIGYRILKKSKGLELSSETYEVYIDQVNEIKDYCDIFYRVKIVDRISGKNWFVACYDDDVFVTTNNKKHIMLVTSDNFEILRSKESGSRTTGRMILNGIKYKFTMKTDEFVGSLGRFE